MAEKRKASPKASPDHGEYRIKHREAAPVDEISKEVSGHDLSRSTHPLPLPIAATMAMHSRSIPRRWPVKDPGADLANQIWFLETVTSDEDFLSSNNIAGITSTLKKARESFGEDAPWHGVSEDRIENAKALLQMFKTRCAPKLSLMLIDLAEKVMLRSPLSYCSLIIWYLSIDTNLHDLREYAYGYGLGKKWDEASSNIQKKFDEGMRQLRSQGAVDKHLTSCGVEIRTQEQPVESFEQSPCPLELLAGPRKATKINKIFDNLIAYYQRQVVDATKTGTVNIFQDLHTIKLCIAKLFSDCLELKSTLEELIGKDKMQGYHAWRLKYEAIWAAPAISAIQKKFWDLKGITAGPALGRAEFIYFEFAKDLQALSMEWDCPQIASLKEWNYLAPRLVSAASATEAAKCFEREYLAFQDHVYAGAELTRLWLLVWRTLKAVKFPLPREPEEVVFPGKESKMSKIDPFAIERAFFESSRSPSLKQISLWDFLQTGDADNPQWIEWFVSKYCNHVARCHLEKEKYYWQFSTMLPKPVPAVVLSTLQTSNQQPTAHPEWNISLHRVVLRLNHLLGDQKVLKRWWCDNKTQSLVYLDINQSSRGTCERGQIQSSGSAPTADDGSSSKESGNDAVGRASHRSVFDNSIGGAAGHGVQDGEGSGDSDSGDKENQDRNSRSPPPPSSSPSFASGSSSLNDEDQFPATIPIKTEASSSSPLNSSNQENITPLVNAGTLATRVLPSAFPWVNYPIAETRATERAMSMQIAREMRQRGVTSHGPHVEDVQNIVPRSLRLAPSPEDADTNRAASGQQSFASRALGVLRGFIARPLPSVRPEPLPSLPQNRSRRRPRSSPLTGNRHDTSGVQRARDRASRSRRSYAGRSPLSRWSQSFVSPFAAQRSWVRRVCENYPWENPNQLPGPHPDPPQDMPSVKVEERVSTPPTAARDTTAGPPSQWSDIFIDRNPVQRPMSPTPASRRGRVQVTNRNTRPATIQQSPERGASPRPYAPAWQWIPRDNEQYREFVEDDRARVNRGDIARLAAHRVFNELIEQNAGHTMMMDLYQLLRARYEWGLTGDYQFPQLVPGYQRPPFPIGAPLEAPAIPRYRPPVSEGMPSAPRNPVGTPPAQRYRPLHGGPGTSPGYLNRIPPGQRESDEMYRGASASVVSSPFFLDSGPDPTLLNRANRPACWGSWKGGANRGNQDFDLYASPANGGAEADSSSRGSVSTLDLPSSSHAQQPAREQEVFSGSGNESRQGIASQPCPAGSNNRKGRRTSGASSLGQRGSPLSLSQGLGNGSQPALQQNGRSRYPEPSSETAAHVHQRTHTSPAPASVSSNMESVGTRPTSDQTVSNQTTGNRAIPTHEQYIQMTVQQLRDEITARGGNPGQLKQRKGDYVHTLMDHDNNGNYGNGAAPRRHARATPVAQSSPRQLRPRRNGKAVNK